MTKIWIELFQLLCGKKTRAVNSVSKQEEILLVENLSRGSSQRLTGAPNGGAERLASPGDYLRLSGGGVILTGHLIDERGTFEISSWTKPGLSNQDFSKKLLSNFARSCTKA